MTNKLERGTRRWNLQMCSLSASRHKSRRGVQNWISLLICTAVPGLPFHWGRPGPPDKRSTLWALCWTCMGADAKQGEFYTPQWFLKPSISEQTAQISTLVLRPHCTLNNKPSGVKTGAWLIHTTVQPRRQSAECLLLNASRVMSAYYILPIFSSYFSLNFYKSKMNHPVFQFSILPASPVRVSHFFQ